MTKQTNSSQPSNLPKNSTDQRKVRRKRTPSPTYSAQEKAQAVLAVWTERTRPAEICRQLAINWVTFTQWQERAMEGMLQALESRVNLASGEALSPRLQALIARRQHPQTASRLLTRLEQIQSERTETLPAKT